MTPRVALVTGGNRGIGLAVVHGLAENGVKVLLGSRDHRQGETAARRLLGKKLLVEPVALNVAHRESIDRLCNDLALRKVVVDVLVNNAGVYPQGGTLDTDEAAFREAMEVHFFGPLRLCQRLVPSMRKRKYGRVVNVSSGYGAFSDGLEGPAAYSLSKAALNALTLKLSSEVGPHIKVNAACPGWVRTRMGGSQAPRSPEKGADTIVWLATLGEDGPNGGFFRDRKAIAW